MSQIPAVVGGGGGSSPYTQTHLKILEKEIRKNPRFFLSDISRKDVPAEMELIATCSEHERNKIAAARVLVAMDRANMDQETKDAGGETLNLNHSGTVEMNDETVLARIARIAARRRLEASSVRPSGEPARPGSTPGSNR